MKARSEVPTRFSFRLLKLDHQHVPYRTWKHMECSPPRVYVREIARMGLELNIPKYMTGSQVKRAFMRASLLSARRDLINARNSCVK